MTEIRHVQKVSITLSRLKNLMDTHCIKRSDSFLDGYLLKSHQEEKAAAGEEAEQVNATTIIDAIDDEPQPPRRRFSSDIELQDELARIRFFKAFDKENCSTIKHLRNNISLGTKRYGQFTAVYTCASEQTRSKVQLNANGKREWRNIKATYGQNPDLVDPVSVERNLRQAFEKVGSRDIRYTMIQLQLKMDRPISKVDLAAILADYCNCVGNRYSLKSNVRSVWYPSTDSK